MTALTFSSQRETASKSRIPIANLRQSYKAVFSADFPINSEKVSQLTKVTTLKISGIKERQQIINKTEYKGESK